jgi:phycoerythrin-associated linker protein
MQAWIRIRHLIFSRQLLIFDTLDYPAVERFEEYVNILGGCLISVEPGKRLWMGNHRQVILYQANASLHTPHHELRQYSFKYGCFKTGFYQRA